MGLWIADEERGLLCPFSSRTLCPQPLCLCACGSAVVCACLREGRVYAGDSGRELACYPLPPGVRCMCALPGALYCLSGEADSLSMLCPMTGQLLLCAGAGCDPRDMTMSPDRRLLAAAGGAAGQLLLYDCRDLRLLRGIPLPGIVPAACFCGAELMALCAVEEGEIAARLYRVSPRGVVSELRRLPGLPGALLSLPDGSLLTGTLGQLLHLRPDGRVLHRFPAALPARLRLYRGFALCADPLDAAVRRLLPREGQTETLYAGGAPADALWI